MADAAAQVVGADWAARDGWAYVVAHEGGLVRFGVVPTLQELLEREPEARHVVVDVPIGHEDPEGAHHRGWRRADLAARSLLGETRASVFYVPPPAVLACADRAEGASLAEARGWDKPSPYTWAIRDRILEADAAAGDPRLVESHPEVAFRRLQLSLGRGERPLPRKDSWDGLHARLELLHEVHLRPARLIGGVGHLAPHDVLDASVLCWVGRLLARGEAVPLPADPPHDARLGRPVAIWS